MKNYTTTFYRRKSWLLTGLILEMLALFNIAQGGELNEKKLQAPVLTNIGTTITFTEESDPVVVTQSIMINDGGAGIQSATIKITQGYTASEDRLTFGNFNDIYGFFDQQKGELILLSYPAGNKATIVNFQNALRSVKYQNINTKNPSNSARNISFTLTDVEGSPSNTLSKSININLQNDAPILQKLEREVANVPGSGTIHIAEKIEVVDLDNDRLTGAVVKFVNSTYQAVYDKLNVTQDVGNITHNWNVFDGTLTLRGVDTKENYEKVLRNLVYSVGGFIILIRSEVKNISITVSDGNKESESVVRYVAVKNPSGVPSWITDITKNTSEDQVFSFSGDDFRNAYFPDKSKFSSIDIRTLPQHGSLIYNGEALTFNDILNNGSGFRIMAADISKLAYKPDENFNGTDQFEWISFDGARFSTSDAFVMINVMEVNDAPILAAPPEINGVPEDSPSTLPEIVVDDLDDQQVQAEVKVEHGLLSVNPYLLNNKLLKFTIGDGQADKVLQFSGPVGYVSYALSALVYQPDNNFSSTDQLSVKVTDRLAEGGSATTTATVNIIIIPSNDAPILAGVPQTPLAYTENDGPVVMAPEITVSDEENNQIVSAAITIQEGFQAQEDKLGFTSGTITGSLNANILTLTGSASLADYQKVLRSVTYENTSENPATVNRVVGFQVKDEEGALSAAATRTITIKNVDDAPVLTELETEKLNFVQFGGPVALTNTIRLSDLDDNVVDKAVITFVDNTYKENEDRFTFANTDKIKSTWDSKTGTLTLTGTASLEEYQQALKNVFYNNISQTPSEKERTVSMQVSSHGSNSNVLTRKITVVVNERPTITSFSREIEEDQSLTFKYEDFHDDGQYHDPDNFPQKDGFSKIAIRALPQHGMLVADGDTLSQADIDASSTGYVIEKEVIAQLRYLPEKDYNGDDRFIWNAFDGAQYALEDASVNINLTPVDDAPVVGDFEKITTEEASAAFSLSDFTAHYSDAEGDTLQKIMIRDTPAEGTLVLNGISIPANTEIGPANISKLTYVPAENFSGNDSFSWSASDGHSFTGNSALVLITVTPVNDPPVVGNFTKAITENEALTFSAEDFTTNYIDVENDPIAYIIIESLTENGSLLLNNQPVNPGDQISTAQLTQLVYQPDASLGGGKDSFSWNASDGTDLAQKSATVTIIVGIGVTDFSVLLNEDEPFTFSPDHFINNYGNPEGELQEIRIEKLPVNGSLTVGEAEVSEGQTISVAALGQLIYTPHQNYFGRDSISWNASDGNSFTNETADIFFNIQSVNDAPAISPLENRSMVAGESTGPVSFTISDVETEASSLVVTAFSNNKTLIADEQITLGGSGNDRTITIDTQEGQTGTAVINILVSDGEKQTQQSFTLVLVPYFITLEAGENIEDCNAQPFDITVQEVSGGVLPYVYTWTCDLEDCSIVGESGNALTINPAATTTYYVQVSDANGIVSNQDTITVSVVDCSDIDLSIPSGFTPNGDGINDTWAIGKIAYLKNVTVVVYNRFGQQVFQSESYATPWDGTSAARILETGTYYYVINVENGSRVFKGSVTILR